MTEADYLASRMETLPTIEAERAAAFEACESHRDDREHGYGTAREYTMADGSVLTHDGRGWTASP